MRTPMVTRTITSTIARVACVNTATRAIEDKEFKLARTYKNEDAVLEAVKAINTDEAIRPSYVVSTCEVEQLYGMTEQEFLAHSNPIIKAAKNDEIPAEVTDAPDEVIDAQA